MVITIIIKKYLGDDCIVFENFTASIGDFNFRTGQNPDFIEKDSSQINDFDGVDLLPPDYVTDTELKRVNHKSLS
jgi:hypothetical protein